MGTSNLTNKIKVHDIAKSFNLPSKEIMNILSEYSTPPKSHSAVMTEEEISIVLDYLTQKNQISSIEVIFADCFKDAEETPKAGKAAPDRAKPRPRDKMSQSKPPTGKGSPAKTEAPAVTEQPSAPRNATRGVKEEVIYLNLFEQHPFKNHPFGVRDDAEMQGLVESVKTAYVN